MARTTVTRTTPLGPYPTLQPAANALDLTVTAADTVNYNQILLDCPMLVIAQNTGASDYTVTITSAVDAQNRTGDITTYTISADDILVFRIDQYTGWRQSDGYLYLQASNAAVKLAAIRIG
jgi:hypothetical protein